MRTCAAALCSQLARSRFFVLCSCYSFAIARVFVLELGPVRGGGGGRCLCVVRCLRVSGYGCADALAVTAREPRVPV